MTSRKSKRFAASRGTAALVLAGMLVLGPGLTAMAQSVDAQNGLEGTWRAGHGSQLSDGCDAEDLPGYFCVRQRGYAHLHDL